MTPMRRFLVGFILLAMGTTVCLNGVTFRVDVKTRIPRIIHQSWKSSTQIPSRFAPWMRSWVEKHPDWQHVFWTDEDNLALFDRLYPQYADVARKVNKIGLADMARYALLHKFGGLYVDADFECKQPFDALHQKYKVFLSSEPRAHAILLEHHDQLALCNALMASVPGHPFWIQVLDAIKDMYDKGLNHGDPVSLTGPRIVKSTYEKYAESDITVLAPEYFYPQVAKWNMHNLLESCDSSDHLVREACDWLLKFPDGEFTKNTHAVHHWQCTWCLGEQDDKKVSIDMITSYALRPFFFRNQQGHQQVTLV